MVAAEVWTPAYLRARELEGRLYPDEVVARLPVVPAGHPLAAEWRQRANSSLRLAAYLAGLGRPLTILEIGCGNGWLANRLAGIPGTHVVGLDANELELGQARRAFGRRENLRFVLGDALALSGPAEPADVIVLASVIQYLPDLGQAIRHFAPWLRPGGEIHILDSPIYLEQGLAGARERTRRHYDALGVPEMTAAYQHHSWAALDGQPLTVLYRPDALLVRVERRLGRPRSPFPWIRVRPVPGV